MPLSERNLDVLRRIQSEWDRAEQDVKRAEQVCHNIVIPAIKELRYGGRRLVDLIVATLATPNDDKAIDDLLADALFDCYRARHDAIDAATSKIAVDLELMAHFLGYDVILAAYPEFSKLYRELQKVRSKIADSRGHRDDREKIYSVIEAADFPELVRLFNELQACEPMMLAMARKSRANAFYGKWGFWVGVLGILLALIMGLVAFT